MKNVHVKLKENVEEWELMLQIFMCVESNDQILWDVIK